MEKVVKKNALKKGFFSYSRLLHVYLSTFLFSLLILFSITGITLNHRWYDSDNNQELRLERAITANQLAVWLPLQRGEYNNRASSEKVNDWEPDLTQITNDLRTEFSLPSPSSIELEPDFKEVILDFKVPAGFATLTLSFLNLTLVLEQEKGSWLGVLNDLHKGRHSGEAWSWVIDLSAALIILFSVTGFIILFQGKKHRRGGVISFVLGSLTPYFIYLFFIPLIGL